MVAGAALALYFKFSDRFGGSGQDPRGFTVSKEGTYGTASWMGERELKEVLTVEPLGQSGGHPAGQTGRQSRLPAGGHPAQPAHRRVWAHPVRASPEGSSAQPIFNIIRRGESAIVTDSKGELYADTVELFRSHGYEVKVFNLVNPEHGDSWNCMADLQGGYPPGPGAHQRDHRQHKFRQGDHFWDNGEGNLLKALILYVDLDPRPQPGGEEPGGGV